MEYSEALDKILGFVDPIGTQTPSGLRSRYDLSQIIHFLQKLGNPHKDRTTVHIAGTKGKGSTSAMTTSILDVAGYTTGLFTSPHLHSFCERIRVGMDQIPEQEFADLVERLLPVREKATLPGRKVTLFELITAMAFSHFKDKGLPVQVMEVGLGGRLDSTNVVDPNVCGITSLGLDHTEVLGDSLAEIAFEKAGIIKPKVPVISAPQEAEALNVLRDIAEERDSRLLVVGEDIRFKALSNSLDGQEFELLTSENTYNLKIPLLGGYQITNAAVTVGIIEALISQGMNITADDIVYGLSKVQWPCRLEVLNRQPLIIADGAHNPHAAKEVVKSIRDMFSDKRIILIAGIQANHDVDKLVMELSYMSPDVVLTTRSRHPRAVDPNSITEMFRSYVSEVYPSHSVKNALDMALNIVKEDDLILSIGSLFVAAETREIINNISPEDYPVFNAQRKN